MKRIVTLTVSLVLLAVLNAEAQQKKFSVRTIAFYNVENLFDTINDPNKFDDDRTPEGADLKSITTTYRKLLKSFPKSAMM